MEGTEEPKEEQLVSLLGSTLYIPVAAVLCITGWNLVGTLFMPLLRFGVTAFAVTSVLSGMALAGGYVLVIHLLSPATPADFPARRWKWGAFVLLAFALGGIMGGAAHKALHGLAFEIEKVTWDREASEFVIHGWIDRDAEEALRAGALRADVSLEVTYIRADGTFDGLGVGGHTFSTGPGAFHRTENYDIVHPRRAVRTDLPRLRWTPPDPDYFHVYGRRLALQFRTPRGAPLGDTIVVPVPYSYGSLPPFRDGKYLVPGKK